MTRYGQPAADLNTCGPQSRFVTDFILSGGPGPGWNASNPVCPSPEDYNSAIMTEHARRTRYAELLRQLEALVEGEPDLIANLANITAVLKEALPAASWVGFYIKRGDDLVLGPFQGLVACTRIAKGRGVCGAAAEKRQSQVVGDVTTFADHIACDANSRSEIVVPIVRETGVLAVLDIDSHELHAFDELDRDGLEMVGRLVATLTWPRGERQPASG